MFHEIKTETDIQDFLERTNQLHDGYVISVVYTNNGIKKTADGHSFSPWMTELTIRVVVTSLCDTIVEIEFDGLYEWQVKENVSDIFATVLSFNDQGHIVWSDDEWSTMEELRDCSYAIASGMKWRIVESHDVMACSTC